MKCFAYISKAATNSSSHIPNELIAILQRSRVKNRMHGLVGFISYRKGRYFQVVEGPDEQVDRLMEKLSVDVRHSDIQVLLETSIKEPSFSNWEMKLVASMEQDPNVMRFFYRHKGKIQRSSPEKLALLKVFFKHQMFDKDHLESREIKLNSRPIKKYKEFEISIETWPNFAAIVPSTQMIEICAHLTRGAISYQELLIKCSGADTHKVDIELDKLSARSLLTYGDKNSMAVAALPQLSMQSAYSRLKSFLSRI